MNRGGTRKKRIVSQCNIERQNNLLWNSAPAVSNRSTNVEQDLYGLFSAATAAFRPPGYVMIWSTVANGGCHPVELSLGLMPHVSHVNWPFGPVLALVLTEREGQA